MAKDRDNDREVTSRESAELADGLASLPQDVNLSSAYATLLEQYREALTRIHVLELQNQNLANMVELSPPPILSQDGRPTFGASDVTELAARVQALESLRERSVADGTAPAGEQASKHESHDEIAQLRIQVQSLLGQLAKVNGRHDKVKRAGSRDGGGHRWHSRSGNRRSWLNRVLKR